MITTIKAWVSLSTFIFVSSRKSFLKLIMKAFCQTMGETFVRTLVKWLYFCQDLITILVKALVKF